MGTVSLSHNISHSGQCREDCEAPAGQIGHLLHLLGGSPHLFTLFGQSELLAGSFILAKFLPSPQKISELRRSVDAKDAKLLALSRALAESNDEVAVLQHQMAAERKATEHSRKERDDLGARLGEKEKELAEVKSGADRQQSHMNTVFQKLRSREKELAENEQTLRFLSLTKNVVSFSFDRQKTQEQTDTITDLETQRALLEERENEAGENVHQLYSRIAMLEKELSLTKSCLEDSREEIKGMKVSVEASHGWVRVVVTGAKGYSTGK